MSLITQPTPATLEKIQKSLNKDTQNIDFAVAYARQSGTDILINSTPITRLRCKKRFLVGIDWFRSDHRALDALAELLDSRVKVFDGRFVVSSNGCRPRKSFHAKSYLFCNSPSSLIVGSSNLSRNGLCTSVELCIETDDKKLVADYSGWFADQWDKATSWESIRAKYIRRYEESNSKELVFAEDEDDDRNVFSIRWVTTERLRQMRESRNLWIDVGRTHNRGKGKPGEQLQFAQMTRVFFGCPAVKLSGNADLGWYTLNMAGAISERRPLRYNGNTMDVLSLPVPGLSGWPASYEEETLLFAKQSDGSFQVTMARGKARANWRRQSSDNGFLVSMGGSSTREWGVF
ncbi:phospholipase D-like domain-containing protein [Rhodopirellula europaea]|uniref:phospholipase D-like domain-containing protein n=1 Tax=Rhodopirellula europaea TaxID=1263866 RepID=UPI003D2D66C7|tara:strand:+ start:10901 stop:11941 length:1041 start_codon:yes stop_codon:yes gene_type:complete